MKMLITIILLICLIVAYFFAQGRQSQTQTPPALAGTELPLCSAKPNCVCSLQSPDDAHFIEPIMRGQLNTDDVVNAIESMGGSLDFRDDTIIKATFTSGIFGFVDDLIVRVDDQLLQVRSSSRVGYSDLGANRKRVEQLRQTVTGKYRL